MKIIECVQGSEEWMALRKSRPTASNMSRILTGTGKPSSQLMDYVYELVGSWAADGQAEPGYTSAAMRAGVVREPEARAFYAFERNVEVEEVGFILSDCGRWGCSPDFKAGEGFGEVKCPQAKTHVKYLLDGCLPTEHKPQVHQQLVVTGAPWIDFVSYCRNLPPLLIRVEPDAYTEKIRNALEDFWDAYAEALFRVYPGREFKLDGMDAPITRPVPRKPVPLTEAVCVDDEISKLIEAANAEAAKPLPRPFAAK